MQQRSAKLHCHYGESTEQELWQQTIRNRRVRFSTFAPNLHRFPFQTHAHFYRCHLTLSVPNGLARTGSAGRSPQSPFPGPKFLSSGQNENHTAIYTAGRVATRSVSSGAT
jgi:hypothetical protein